MADTRTRLLDIMLAPYGVSAEEVLADPDIDKGCRILNERGCLRVLTGPPLMPNTSYAPCVDEEAALTRMRDQWLPFLSRAMRKATLRSRRLGAPMRPGWSILVNPVTLAIAEAAGILGLRLARSRLRDGKREFVPMHEAGSFEDIPSTRHYVRDGSHHDGADYLQGQFLLNHADHVVRHALQLLEDTRFPVRSVSDSSGSATMMELRGMLPDTTCAALVGRPLSDLLGIPGFEAGTAAGDCIIAKAESNEATGRTSLDVGRRFVPAVRPFAGTDMRWVGMTPQWR